MTLRLDRLMLRELSIKVSIGQTPHIPFLFKFKATIVSLFLMLSNVYSLLSRLLVPFLCECFT